MIDHYSAAAQQRVVRHMPRYARRRTQASGRWYRAEEESDRILERLTPFQKMTLSGAYFANLFADMYGAKFGFSTPNQRREKNLTLSFQFLWSCWAAWICLKSFWSDFSVAFSLFSGWVFYLHTIYLWASYCGHFKPEFQYWLHFWFGSMIHGSSFLSVLGTHLDGSSLETLFDTWPTLASVLSDDLYGSPLLRYAVTFGPCVVTQMLFWTETEYWAVNLYEFFFHEPTANRHTLLVYQVIAPFLPFAVWHRLFNPRDDLLTDIPFGIGPGTILGVLLLLYVEFTYVDAVGQSWKSWPMFVEGGRGWMIQYKDDDEYEPPYGIKPVPMALYGGPEGVQFGQEEEPRMRELFEEEPPKEEDAAGGKSDTTPSRRPTAPTRLKPVGNPKKQKRYRAKEQSDYQTKLPFGEFIWH